jgi:hypothetical protein
MWSEFLAPDDDYDLCYDYCRSIFYAPPEPLGLFPAYETPPATYTNIGKNHFL